MGESYSYQVPVKQHEGDTGAPPTQAEREQMRAPGRAIYNAGTGEYRVEQVEQGNAAPAANEDRSNFWDFATDESGAHVDIFASGLDARRTFIPVPDGRGGYDRTSLAAARASGLVKKDGAGKWLPTGGSPSSAAPLADKTEEKPDEKQADTSSTEDRVPELRGDATLGRIAEAVGDATVYQLIGQAALGEPLTEAKAQSIAQVLGVDPENVQGVHSALITEYSEVGTKALMAAGVAEEKCADAMAWLAEHKKGDLLDAVTDMVRQGKRSTTALKALGREFVKATGGGYSDAELRTFSLPSGARWHDGPNGELLITIDGWGTTSAQGALRQGVLKA